MTMNGIQGNSIELTLIWTFGEVPNTAAWTPTACDIDSDSQESGRIQISGVEDFPPESIVQGFAHWCFWRVTDNSTSAQDNLQAKTSAQL